MYPIEKLQKIINDEIARRSEGLNSREPAELYIPVAYSLGVGGKRLRPVLLLMAYNLFSEKIENALPAAMAVEVFHNFTLLHDDIMDKAEVRRNKPAVHVKFSENNAILSGDSMAFLSYQYLMECRSQKLFEVIKLFTDTALEVCEGQQYDMDFENRPDVTESEYIRMIRLKTAVLIGCSLKAGALLADASPENARQLYDFGINLGLAFQLQDDWLDTFGQQENFGKNIGGDIAANKKTYLLIKALEKATSSQKNELENWLGKKDFDPQQKINAVTKIFTQLGIKELTTQKIDFYFNQASQLLKNLPLPEEKKLHLQLLSNKILVRNH